MTDLATYVVSRPKRKSDLTRTYWTPERIVEAVHQHVQTHGRIPAGADWAHAAPEHPAQPRCLNVFGSWNTMIRAAGYTPRTHRGNVWTPDLIADAMLTHLLRHGRWPVASAWQRRRSSGEVRPMYSTVVRICGSWAAAKRHAGWDGRDPRSKTGSFVDPRCGECGTELDNQTLGCSACGDRVRKRAMRRNPASAVAA